MRTTDMRRALFFVVGAVSLQVSAGCGPGSAPKNASSAPVVDAGATNIPPDSGGITVEPDGAVAPMQDAAVVDTPDANAVVDTPDAMVVESPDAAVVEDPPDASVVVAGRDASVWISREPDAGMAGGSPDANLTVDDPVVIPSNWRETSLFADRFKGSDSERSIGLAATSFEPSTQVEPDGRFPNADTTGAFPPDLIREPFVGTRLDLFLVQAHSPDDLVVVRDVLGWMRVKIEGYVPNNAYMVWLDPQDTAELRRRPEVSWIGLMQPAWRIAPKLDYLISMEAPRPLRVAALLSSELLPTEQDVMDAVTHAGFTVTDVVRRSRDWKVHLEGSTADVTALALMPECTWVERDAPLIYHNNIARTSTFIATGRQNADAGTALSGPLMDVEDVWARGIRGEDQIVANADSGLSTGDLATLHKDFGEQGSATNPLRVIATYALGRTNDWSDNQSVGAGGHGTHTSGSILGNGFRSGSDPANNVFPSYSYAGIAPKAQLVMQSTMGSTGSPVLPADLNTLFLQAYNAGARIHSNSWGSAVAGDYTTRSQDVDEFSWNYKDMTIVFSAGNTTKDGWNWTGITCDTTTAPDGIIDTDSIDAPGTAKNSITVGASENYRPVFVSEYPENDCFSTNGMEQMTWGWLNACNYSGGPVFADLFANKAVGLGAFSGRGPTNDGRFKPDLVAPGSAIISTRTDKNQVYTAWGTCAVPTAYRTFYIAMTGTSQAAPLVSGAAALVRQYYAKGWHAKDSTVTNYAPVLAHAFNPSAALIKATLINGAWDMTPGQFGNAPKKEIPPSWDTGVDVPNNAEGYGRIDVESALFPGTGYGQAQWRQMLVKDVTPGLQTGQTHNYNITVSANTSPLIVTLVWTDPYAAVSASPALVNNLDLTVSSPAPVSTYYANKKDKALGLDTRNNVEQVIVSAPKTGTWTITVNGLSVPGNGPLETRTQPYALVASAVMAAPCSSPSAPSGLTAVANGYNRVDLSWNTVTSNSYRVYRSTTSGGPYTRIATDVASTSFSDTVGVSGGKTYYYVVSAFNTPACESAQSTQASATTVGDCSNAPTFSGLVTATGVEGIGCLVRLDWNAGTNNCGTSPLVYNVYRSPASGFNPGPDTLLANCVTDTYYEDSTIADGRTVNYYYVVRAEDHAAGGTGVCQGGNEDTNLVEIAAWPIGNRRTVTLYSNGFESGTGLGDWSIGGFGAQPSWSWVGIQNCSPHAGTKVFRFGGATCTGDYANSLWQWSRPDPITIPRSSINAKMTFWHRRAFAGTGTASDGAYLLFSLDNYTYYSIPANKLTGAVYNGTVYNGTTPLAAAYTGTNLTWNQTILDVDACCNSLFGGTAGCQGRDVYLGFAAKTTASVTNDGWFLDDVSVTADVPSACVTVPSPVKFLTATAGNGQTLLEWKNPGTPYGSTMIRYRTDGTYPTSTTDGTQLVIRTGTANAYDSYTHTGQVNGTRYYYSVFVNNGSSSYSGRRIVNARPFAASTTSKWAYATGASAMAPPGIGSVYAVSNDRVLHSMQPGATGGMWPSGWTPFAMNGASVARPVIVPNNAGPAPKTVFVSSTDGHVYAINGETGASVWSTPPLLGDMLVSSPAAMFTAYGGSANLVFIGTRNSTAANQLRALNVSNGTIAWSFDNGGGANGIGIISGTPVVSYSTNRVFFTSRARSGGSTKTVWAVNISAGAGTKAWENQVAVGDSDAAPALKGTKLYVGNNVGKVYALNSADGTNAWTGGGPYDTADGPVKDYLWVTNSEIVFSTTNKVWAITDSGDRPTLLWQVNTIPSPSPPLVVQSAKHAIVGSSDGKLYKVSYASLPPTVTQVQLGDGLAAVGSPAMDAAQNLIHVGTEAGDVHAVSYLSMP